MKLRTILILILFIAPALLSFILARGTSLQITGKPAPDFSAQLLNGNTLNLSDYSGKTVILNFWATWCTPCRTEMPLLQTIHENNNAIVLAINNTESPQQIHIFMDENSLSLPIVLDPKGTLQNQFSILGYPTTIFINKDGIIYAVHTGELTKNMLQKYLEQSISR